MEKEKNTEASSACPTVSVGGQAVIEGVMMKNGSRVALSVRKEDGSIEVNVSEFHHAKEKHKWLNIPIIRGIVGFVESLILSFKTMGKATDMLGLDEDGNPKPKEAVEDAEPNTETVESKEQATEPVESKSETDTDEKATEPVKEETKEPTKDDKKKAGGSTVFAM